MTRMCASLDENSLIYVKSAASKQLHANTRSFFGVFTHSILSNLLDSIRDKLK